MEQKRIITKECSNLDKLPAELRKHYEASMQHNQELMKQLANM
jgi:hypothetical protein